MREVADGVYFENGFGSGIVGCVTTSSGAILVDSPMRPADASAWLNQLAQVSPEGLAFLIKLYPDFIWLKLFPFK